MTTHDRPHVLICTAKDQDDWRDALAQCLPDATLHVGIDAPPCDYAVVWKPPHALFGRQTKLKAIFSLGAGVNALVSMPSLPRDVPLVRMEDGGMADQLVEYALYVALRRLRGFAAYESDQQVQRWSPLPARARHELRVGVLGLGALGEKVARALADFGFTVTGWSRTPKNIAGIATEHGPDGLDRVLARSDLAVVLLPLTDATRGILDTERLRMLPAGASIANLSRGEVLDDAALLALLDADHIDEAHLDVFAQEPLPVDHPYWRHPRVHMTPHVAALTDPLVAAREVADKIRRLEAGLPITGVVNFERQY
ncbi:2-hydroxyacid dehydrogenase [Lysobacter soli]|uniref:2-hydroxyacid dehydrogenase n=1 Tax=Lysobacter soli TaxID=453783 RepID=UPI00240F014C|nr:glyoxylate/hydroxypyruvate reductase A [Lysobacter soli]MDG2517980.1 glyoxylate/hydroxypyruvate reductase A [Lysobacter soli]